MLALCDKYFLRNRFVFGSNESNKKKNYTNKCVKTKHRKIECDKFFSLSGFTRNSQLEYIVLDKMDNPMCTATIYSSKIWDMGYIHLCHDSEEDFSMFILTDKRNLNYVITGIVNKQPFIIAPKFTYIGTSVCSKYENYLEELGKNPKITEIYATLWLFYHDFPNNNYH